MPILFILLFQLTAAHASLLLSEAQCTGIDIRDVNPALREHFSTPLNQDSIGWCFGFSAADMLTAKTGRPVSAYHVSAIYNRAISRDFIWRTLYSIGDSFQEGNLDDVYEGGYIGRALEAAKRNQTVCSEEQLPFDASYGGTRDVILQLETLRDQIRQTRDQQLRCELVETAFPDGLYGNTNFIEIQALLARDNLNASLAQIVSSACREDPVPVGDFNIRKKDKPSPQNARRVQEYLQMIGDSLRRGMPLGISWNPGRVSSPGRHASTVIARRWENGKCQYKIRNSWGTGCYSYKSNVDCNAREGAFWVNDEDFHEMVSGITTID